MTADEAWKHATQSIRDSARGMTLTEQAYHLSLVQSWLDGRLQELRRQMREAAKKERPA